MQRLEVSGAVRLIYRSLGVKGLMYWHHIFCGFEIFVKNELQDFQKQVLKLLQDFRRNKL